MAPIRLSTLFGCFAVGVISAVVVPGFNGLIVAAVASVIFAILAD